MSGVSGAARPHIHSNGSKAGPELATGEQPSNRPVLPGQGVFSGKICGDLEHWKSLGRTGRSGSNFMPHCVKKIVHDLPEFAKMFMAQCVMGGGWGVGCRERGRGG